MDECSNCERLRYELNHLRAERDALQSILDCTERDCKDLQGQVYRQNDELDSLRHKLRDAEQRLRYAGVDC